MKIISNNIPRELLMWFDLTSAEQADFDYIAPDRTADHWFFRYRGHAYDTGEFSYPPDELAAAGYHFFASDTYFSGVAFKYTEDYEQIVVALVLA